MDYQYSFQPILFLFIRFRTLGIMVIPVSIELPTRYSQSAIEVTLFHSHFQSPALSFVHCVNSRLLGTSAPWKYCITSVPCSPLYILDSYASRISIFSQFCIQDCCSCAVLSPGSLPLRSSAAFLPAKGLSNITAVPGGAREGSDVFVETPIVVVKATIKITGKT